MRPPDAPTIPTEACTDEVLLNDWHVVAASADVTAGQLVAATLLERDLVPDRLIRAGIGYSLAHDEKALERLTERWSAFIPAARASSMMASSSPPRTRAPMS